MQKISMMNEKSGPLMARYTGVPVRPWRDRVRDTAIVAGVGGSVSGAVLVYGESASVAVMLRGALWAGGHWAIAAAAFVGLRQAMLQDRWQEDREVVSGSAAAFVGAAVGAARGGPRAMGQSALAGFFGGCALHWLHRHWLRHQLDTIEGVQRAYPWTPHATLASHYVVDTFIGSSETKPPTNQAESP